MAPTIAIDNVFEIGLIKEILSQVMKYYNEYEKLIIQKTDKFFILLIKIFEQFISIGTHLIYKLFNALFRNIKLNENAFKNFN